MPKYVPATINMFNRWYYNDSGRVLFKHPKSWLTCAVSVETCVYMIKNHITGKSFRGHGGTPRHACKRANEVINREIRETPNA